MIKIFRKLHLWLSVPFGIIITLICFSGAMMIFEPEITRAVNRDVYYVADVKESPLEMGAVMESVKATLPDGVDITSVTVSADKSRTWQVNLSKPKRASVFVDQYTGEVTGHNERPGFFSTMFKLHRWLLDSANPNEGGVHVGKLLVGISTLFFVISLITGIVIWLPRARNNFRRSMSIPFSKGWKGFWKGLHVAGGMYALFFVLAMALTGLTWSFDWYRSAFYAVCGVENTPRKSGGAAAVATTADGCGKRCGGGGCADGCGSRRAEVTTVGGAGSVAELQNESRAEAEVESNERGLSEFSGWQAAYTQLSNLNPDAPQITVSAGTATVTLGNTGNNRASDLYSFDPRNGRVELMSKYSDSVEADKLRGWIYSIHTGSPGGWVTRILWFIGALLGATLPLTGYYIWIKHK